MYEYEYNSLGLISKEKRPRGNGYTFSYDAKGNMIEKRFKTNVNAPESSHDLVTLMTYNSQNKLTSQTDTL
jgi:YD repeat-containing protein